MKSFFERVSRSFAAVKDLPSSSSSLSSSSRNRSRTQTRDPYESVIISAAQSVSDAINLILTDAASLQANVDGYHRLLLILECTAAIEERTIEDLIPTVGQEGSENFELLLRLCNHSSFVERCNETELATALMHALRLLRMYEIKQAKNYHIGILIDDPTYIERHKQNPQRGITYVASERLSKVFCALVADTRSIELFRPSLLKLFTFPLGILPETAKHLHEHSAVVVSKLCSVGFNAQQVWYLHDIQVIAHMVQSLTELVSDEQVESSEESGSGCGSSSEPKALRGMIAEEAGLWVSAVSCLVDVITATLAVGSVLMDDFETAGGRPLLVRIIENSSSSRVMDILNAVTRMFFDASKLKGSGNCNRVAHPVVGSIFEDLLKHVTGLDNGIDSNSDLGSLVQISRQLVTDRPRNVDKECIVQNVAYLLLTVYSSDQSNCSLLEENYNLLPLLVICLPALNGWDSISAVLTTMNYVCQCIDSTSTLPMVTLCAAAVVMMQSALSKINSSDHRDFALQQMEITCSSFEAVIRGQMKYATVVVRGHLLKYMLAIPLQELHSMIVHQGVETLDQKSIDVFTKVIDFIFVVLHRSLDSAHEVRSSGCLDLILAVVAIEDLSLSFEDRLLKLLGELAATDAANLAEAFRGVLGLLRSINGSSSSSILGAQRGGTERANPMVISNKRRKAKVIKTHLLCSTLRRMMSCSNEGNSVWRGSYGWRAMVELIGCLNNGFDMQSGPLAGIIRTENVTEATDCLISTLSSYVDCIATDFALSPVIDKTEKDYDMNRAFFRDSCSRDVVNALLETKIFHVSECADRGLHIIFGLLRGYVGPFPLTSKAVIINPEATEIIIDLLSHVPLDVAKHAIELLIDHALSSVDGCQLLCEEGISGQIISALLDTQSRSPLRDLYGLHEHLIKLLKTLMTGYLLHKDFTAVFCLSIRRDVFGDEYRYKLLPPWQAMETHRDDTIVGSVVVDGNENGISLRGLQFLLEIVKDMEGSPFYTSVPHFAMGLTASSLPFLEQWIAKDIPPPVNISKAGTTISPASTAPLFPSHLTVQLGETAKFPGNNFTFSTWVRLPISSTLSMTTPYTLPSSVASIPSSNTVSSLESTTRDVIPLLSLTCWTAVFLELHWDVKGNFLRVATKRGSIVTTLQFDLPPLLVNNPNAWHLFAITLQPKRIWSKSGSISSVSMGVGTGGPSSNSGNKWVLQIMFDGLVCQAIGDDSVDIDMPLVTAPVELAIGKFAMDIKTVDYEGVQGDFSLIQAQRLPLLWQLGPTLLFQEPLTRLQVASIYLRGPHYTGNFQAESPLADSLPTLACDVLRRCDIASVPVDDYIKLLGFQGLELVVDPTVDPSNGTVTTPSTGTTSASSTFELPSVPPPLLAYSAAHTSLYQLTQEEVQNVLGGSNRASGSRSQSPVMDADDDDEDAPIMPNFRPHLYPRASSSSGSKTMDNVPCEDTIEPDVIPAAGPATSPPSKIFAVTISNAHAGASMTRLPVARLVNGWKVARPASEASCIAALGGPSILFPILQSATTTTQICDFFYLLRMSVDESLNNLRYMQNKGYKIISFILSLKPKTLTATSDVMDALFELCIHRGITITDENIETETLLLINTPALYYLLLNQQVWNARSFTYPQRILCYLTRLVHDPRHGSLNSRRLASLGVLRWLLLMSAYGVERGSIVSAGTSHPNATTDGSDTTKNNRKNDTNVVNANVASSKRIVKTPSPSIRGSKTTFPSKSSTTTSTPIDMVISGEDTEWQIHAVTSIDMVEGKDSPDPFLSCLISILRAVLNTNTSTYTSLQPAAIHGKRDFDFFAHIISYSFSVTSLSSTLLARKSKGATTRKSGTDSTRTSITTTTALSPLALLRCYLLRLVIDSLLESCKRGALAISSSIINKTQTTVSDVTLRDKEVEGFRVTFSPEWFFGILDRCEENLGTTGGNGSNNGMIVDAASKSLVIRLLCMLLQSDPTYLREFNANHGLAFLFSIILSSQEQSSVSLSLPHAVHCDATYVLPLLALLFRLPMIRLPALREVPSVAAAVALLDQAVFVGPEVGEQSIREFYLPLLSATVACLSVPRKDTSIILPSSTDTTLSNDDPNATGVSSAISVNDVILAVFAQGFVRFAWFRQLLQHRQALQTLSSTLAAFVMDEDASSHHQSYEITSTTTQRDTTMDVKTGVTRNAVQEAFAAVAGGNDTDNVETLHTGANKPTIPKNPFLDSPIKTKSPSSGTSSTTPMNIHTTDEDITDRYGLTLGLHFHPEGRMLLDLLLLILRSSFDMDNPAVTRDLFVCFPSSALDAEQANVFQLLLVRSLRTVLSETLDGASSGNQGMTGMLSTLSSISEALSLLVPLAKELMFCPAALRELLAVILYTLGKSHELCMECKPPKPNANIDSILERYHFKSSNGAEWTNSSESTGGSSGTQVARGTPNMTGERERNLLGGMSNVTGNSNNSSTGREKDRSKDLEMSALTVFKDLGTSARYFASFCVKMIDMNSPTSRTMTPQQPQMPLPSTGRNIRESTPAINAGSTTIAGSSATSGYNPFRMSSIGPRTPSKGVSSFSPSSNSPSPAHSVPQPSSSSMALGGVHEETEMTSRFAANVAVLRLIREHLSLLLPPPGVLEDKSDFDPSAPVVIRHSTTSSSTSSSNQKKQASADLLTALAEKQKLSETFCMALLSTSLNCLIGQFPSIQSTSTSPTNRTTATQLPMDHSVNSGGMMYVLTADKACLTLRMECGRLLALLFAHRPTLVEQLLIAGRAAAQSLPSLPSGQSEDETMSVEFYVEGLMQLLQGTGGAARTRSEWVAQYETYLRMLGSTSTQETSYLHGLDLLENNSSNELTSTSAEDISPTGGSKSSTGKTERKNSLKGNTSPTSKAKIQDESRAERNRVETFLSWLGGNRVPLRRLLIPMNAYLGTIAPGKAEKTETSRTVFDMNFFAGASSSNNSNINNNNNHLASSSTASMSTISRADSQLTPQKNRSLHQHNTLTPSSANKLVSASATGAGNTVRYPSTGGMGGGIVGNASGLDADQLQRKMYEQISYQLRRWLVQGFAHLSAGAFSWRRAWLALQAGPVWGYMSLPLLPTTIHSSMGDDEDGKEVFVGKEHNLSMGKELKRWSLDAAEGPERVRKRLQQEYNLTLVLKESSALAVGGIGMMGEREEELRRHEHDPSHDIITTQQELMGELDGRAASTELIRLHVGGSNFAQRSDADLFPSGSPFQPSTPITSSSQHRSPLLGGRKARKGTADVDMEYFLKEVTQRGIIRKSSMRESSFDNVLHDDPLDVPVVATFANTVTMTSTDKSLMIPTATGVDVSMDTEFTMPDMKPSESQIAVVVNQDHVSLTPEHISTEHLRGDMDHRMIRANSVSVAGESDASLMDMDSDDGFDDTDFRYSPETHHHVHPVDSYDVIEDATTNARLAGTSGGPGASDLLSGWYFITKEPSNVRLEDSHTRPMGALSGDTEVFKRSALLLELAKGAVGATEWHNGRKFNVQRIFGLESQSALVILTRKNLHIVSGFRVRAAASASTSSSSTGTVPTSTAPSAANTTIGSSGVGAGTTGGIGASTTGTSATGITDAPTHGKVVVEWVSAIPSAEMARDNVYKQADEEHGKNSGRSGKIASKKATLAAAEAAYAAAIVGLDNGTNTSSSAAATDIPPIESITDADVKEQAWLSTIWMEVLSSDHLSHHCMPLDEIYMVFKRRHHLKNTALELTDIHGYSLLFSCESETRCNDMLLALFEAELPASIFYSVIGMKNLQLLRGLSNMYNRLMSMFLSSMTARWQKGEISNFEYLMHLNAAAGRSFQDLTQYPVFPWILADYTSTVLDLTDPKTFRDLSKPMGALGLKRAKQYRDRYRTMDEFRRNDVEGSPPPFYYGTHYSCAGYALHYLIRLQPYSSMAIALQGGHFDKSDRLFVSIEQAWLSASSMNLQDVRELIPEFFCLPEFLTNSNKFDFGATQKGDVVNDVQLPPWAKGDPKEFIRLHREALESKYVSEHLHEWVDLIFGFKQRGPAAEEAMNVFIHLTYDGEVDVDAITDPIMRDATIAQINNFGQTPSRLFDKPHPPRVIPDVLKRTNASGTGNTGGGSGSFATSGDILVADPIALAWHERVTPALCVAGAPLLPSLMKQSYAHVSYPPSLGNVTAGSGGASQHRSLQLSLPIADLLILKDKGTIVAVPKHCRLLSTATGMGISKRYIDFSLPVGGLSTHSLAVASSSGSSSSSTSSSSVFNDFHDREGTFHERLHEGPITCVATGLSGNDDVIVTGSSDSTLKLWGTSRLMSSRRLDPLFTFAGHRSAITSVDISTDFHVIVSGAADGTTALWDTRSGRMLRLLGRKHTSAVLSVSINPLSGHIATLSALQLALFTINGEVLAEVNNIASDGLTADVSARRDGLSLSSISEDDNATVMSHMTASAATNPCTMPRARVVLAPPCAEWLPGVEVITGHDHGHIYLWKLHITPRNRSFLATSLPSSLSSLDPNHSEFKHDNEKESITKTLGHHRQLLAFPLPGPQLTSTTNHPSKGTKSSSSSSSSSTHHHHHHQSNPNPHRASITVLRVLSINPTRTKEFADRSFHLTSGPTDLLVGDEQGFVSRWSPARLDNLSPTDLNVLVTTLQRIEHDNTGVIGWGGKGTAGPLSSLRIQSASMPTSSTMTNPFLKLLSGGSGVTSSLHRPSIHLPSPSPININFKPSQEHTTFMYNPPSSVPSPPPPPPPPPPPSVTVHETASVLAAKTTDIEDMNNDESNMENF